MLRTHLEQHWSQHRLVYRVLFFLTLSLGLYLGMRPAPPPTPFQFNMIDSVYHAGGLFVCTLLSYMGYPRWRWWVRGAVMFSVGLAVEYVQSFHSTRTADIGDIYANSFGVAVGLAVVILWRRG